MPKHLPSVTSAGAGMKRSFYLIPGAEAPSVARRLGGGNQAGKCATRPDCQLCGAAGFHQPPAVEHLRQSAVGTV